MTRDPATFWMRNESTGREEKIRVRYANGRFTIPDLKPGSYGLDVRIRSGQGFSRHFTAWKPFTVVDGVPVGEVVVAMSRIIHLTSPQDNDTGMDRWSARCEGKMAFPSPVRFAWEPVVGDAIYYYSVEDCACEPFHKTADVVTSSTTDTSISLNLPPSEAGHVYLFRLHAEKDGQRVGGLETYGRNGGRGWDYRFRVE